MRGEREVLKSEGEHVCVCVCYLVTINAWVGDVFVCLLTRRGERNLLLNQSIHLKVVFLILRTCVLVKCMNSEQCEVNSKGGDIKKQSTENKSKEDNLSKKKGKETIGGRSQVQRDGGLASCSYITMTPKERQGGCFGVGEVGDGGSSAAAMRLAGWRRKPMKERKDGCEKHEALAAGDV